MLVHMVNYNAVKRKTRFRSQKSNFLRVFRERLFPRSEVHLVTWPELVLFGFLLASPEEQDTGSVTAVRYVLTLSPGSPDHGQSVYLWRQGSAQTRGFLEAGKPELNILLHPLSFLP